ncbi:hypothetical protein [Helicobacter vulpis]|uniref:hypothetical protein n=1 Tax=Helicobacter vulpis TaxID=2316076 RepID=UPI001F3021C9|nr:hypothetical protein [Helicobacter vulpis]
MAHLVAKEAQEINWQALLKQHHIPGKVVKSVDEGPDFKVLIVDHKGKWEAWWVDKQTLKLANQRPDDYPYGADPTYDEIWAHNQAIPTQIIKMWNLFYTGPYATMRKDMDVSYFKKALLSLKPLQGTDWQSVTFDGPSVWLIDENTTQAIEVQQAFGDNAALFKKINARAQTLRAKKAPLLFGSFFEALPKPCLDHFPSTNPKAPDLYLVLNFDNSDLHYTNLYQRTKEILEQFPTIVKRYRVHVFALKQDIKSCDTKDISDNPYAPGGYSIVYMNNPPCEALFQSYQQLKAQFHATSPKGTCVIPDGQLAEEPQGSKKVGDTGRNWEDFLFGIDSKHNDTPGYIDNNNPTPIIYNPKIGLIKARDFLKSLDAPMGDKPPKKAQGLSAYKVVKKASLSHAPFQIVLLQDKQSLEQSVWLYSPQAKLWFKPGRVRKLHKNDQALLSDFKEEASGYNYVKAYAKPLKTFFHKAHSIDLVPKNAKKNFYVITSASPAAADDLAYYNTPINLVSKIIKKVQQGNAVHIILVGSLSQLPTDDCGDTSCDGDEETWVAQTCFNAANKAKNMAEKLGVIKNCGYGGDYDFKDPGESAIAHNSTILTDDSIGMFEAQGWNHLNEFLPDPDQQ